jgi:hypothetical protein
MNKKIYMSIVIIIIASCIIPYCNAKFSLKNKIKSFLESNLLEKIDQQEFSATSINSLSLANINGSVIIKTGPKKTLFLRTIKRAKKTASLEAIKVITEIHDNHLAITTKNNNKKKNGRVDYELIVPASFNIAINITGSGDVFIKDVHGAIDVVTLDNVTIVNTKKLASIQTLRKGNITFHNANGPIEACTHKGNIVGENITHNCDARSTHGKIAIAYKKLPATSSINLFTTSGNIELALPAETNAILSGHTTYGTFMSEHDITLKSYTTKLDKTAWAQFTRHVDGSLGMGDATINIHSTSGNVRIIQTITT